MHFILNFPCKIPNINLRSLLLRNSSIAGLCDKQLNNNCEQCVNSLHLVKYLLMIHWKEDHLLLTTRVTEAAESESADKGATVM